jgi:hypothetical protein
MRRQFMRLFVVAAVSVTLTLPQTLCAQDHVVSPADIRRDLQTASDGRQKQIEQIDRFLSSEQAQKALSSTHVEYQQVEKAVRTLSDDDLTKIANRAQRAEDDFSAGNITTTDLVWIILGVVVVILIIVAVRK